LSEIESALNNRGQFLAFEPPAFKGAPTIGGVIAAGLAGPRRMYAGAARDFVLGVTLLDARGEILRFGGQVMKNVAGFDVSRLLCGSLGILACSLKYRSRCSAAAGRRDAAIRDAGATGRRSLQSLERTTVATVRSGLVQGSGLGAAIRRASAVRAAHERLGGERVDSTAALQWWNALRHHTHPIFESTTVWRLSVPTQHRPWTYRAIP